MKKDKKFLEELENNLGNFKFKDEIISKYKEIIYNEKSKGKKIKDIIRELGDTKLIAEQELEKYKSSNKTNIFDNIKEKFLNLKDKLKKNKKNVKSDSSTKNKFIDFITKDLTVKTNKKKNKKEKINENKKFSLFNKKETKVKDQKNNTKIEDKENVLLDSNKVEKDDNTKKSKKFSLFNKKETKVKNQKNNIEIEDNGNASLDNIESEEEKIVNNDIKEIIVNSKSKKSILVKVLAVCITCILVFIWLWITVLFFASIFAYLDGIKFKGIVLLFLFIDLLVLWLVLIVNKSMFKKKMNAKVNLIVSIILVTCVAFFIVKSYKEVTSIKKVQDVSEKYTMTRKLETYDLPKENNSKFIITFNSNYNTQYVIKHDKNIKGKVKVDIRYYECYYDYYVKKSTEGVYISLKLDDRDRFSTYLDDIKEGKIYDDDELSRYTVKITVNPNEADKIAIQ